MLTQLAIDIIVNGTVPDSMAEDDNPFERENRNLYLHFDTLSIENVPNNSVRLSFEWHGRVFATKRIEGIGLTPALDQLHLNGFEGRMLVTISPDRQEALIERAYATKDKE